MVPNVVDSALSERRVKRIRSMVPKLTPAEKSACEKAGRETVFMSEYAAAFFFTQSSYVPDPELDALHDLDDPASFIAVAFYQSDYLLAISGALPGEMI